MLKNRAERVPLAVGLGGMPFGEVEIDTAIGLSLRMFGSPDTSCVSGFSFSDTSGRFEGVPFGERDRSNLRPMIIWYHVGRGPGERELLRGPVRVVSRLWRLFAFVDTDRRLRVALA